MKAPDLDDYRQLLEFYRDAIKSEQPQSLQLPLERVFRMLTLPSAFNASLPTPFIQSARRYQQRKTDALRHFADPEVQQFFLSDLYDLIRLKTLQAQRSAKKPEA